MSFKEIVKSSGKTLLTTVGVTAIGFFISVLTARMLGPEGRGLLSGAVLIVTLSSSVAACGLAFSYIYHRGAGQRFHQKRFVFLSALFIGLLAAVLALGGLLFNHDPQLRGHMALITGFALVTALQNYLVNLTQMQPSLSFLNVTRIVGVFLNLAALVLLFLAFRPVEFVYVLIGQLVCALTLIALCLHWAGKNVFQPVTLAPDAQPPRDASTGHLLKYAFNQHGTVLIGLALTNFDKVYLLKVGTIVEFGYYSLAFTTSRLIGVLFDAMNTALYSRYAGKDEKELTHSINIAFRLTFLPMMALAGIGALLSPWLIQLVYGPKFASVTPTFCVLMFECVVSGAGWTLAQRFNAAGRPGLVLVRQLISVLPVVALLPFLPKENISVYLGLLMLLGASLRMAITLAIYPYVLKEPVPRLFPSRDELQKGWSMIKARLQARRVSKGEPV
ncbi:oligosaccharide flippase family protein [Herbaspirillum sp. LeCh32-8]|uniref:lipopolysaccharide biosynthesis protein n=1 Tax=Herbaspirillum sp. LeCh32-8 TaxID=2821356 RepID=UPI001AE8BDFD|nr:oligosaccharide flippase family protein [Herbaspirillum sp. LeCh32-8]MBP0596920.1 oligosaccharide flippase family protein [Herbaspirillum sp. LeCh32-8]